MMCELVTYIIARARNKNKGTSAPNELAPLLLFFLLLVNHSIYSIFNVLYDSFVVADTPVIAVCLADDAVLAAQAPAV